MSWFNYYGLILIALIMIPNVIYAIKNKNGYANAYQNKAAEVLEQLSRYACMVFMIFNIPYTWRGFYFPYAKVVYLAVNGILVLAYLVAWTVLWKKRNVVKALLLSILPSAVFVFSGIMIASIPLIAFAVVFSITHILISVKNSALTESAE